MINLKSLFSRKRGGKHSNEDTRIKISNFTKKSKQKDKYWFIKLVFKLLFKSFIRNQLKKVFPDYSWQDFLDMLEELVKGLEL